MSYNPNAGGGAVRLQIWGGGRESYDLQSPALIVGGFEFDKSLYTFSELRFRALAARGDAIDAEVNLGIIGGAAIATLTFTSTSVALQSSADIQGSMPGASTLYEVTINVAAAPGADDAVELYKAWLEVIP